MPDAVWIGKFDVMSTLRLMFGNVVASCAIPSSRKNICLSNAMRWAWPFKWHKIFMVHALLCALFFLCVRVFTNQKGRIMLFQLACCQLQPLHSGWNLLVSCSYFVSLAFMNKYLNIYQTTNYVFLFSASVRSFFFLFFSVHSFCFRSHLLHKCCISHH